MANKNRNLDNFFREQLSDYEAPERKGNWQLLNHLLDARERKRKMVWRIFFLSSFVAVMLLSYLIFMPGDEKNKNISGGENTNRAVVAPPQAPEVTGTAENKNNVTGSDINKTDNIGQSGNIQSKIKKSTQKSSKQVADSDKDAIAQQSEKNSDINLKKRSEEDHSEMAGNKNQKQNSVTNAGDNLSAKESSIESQKLIKKSIEVEDLKNTELMALLDHTATKDSSFVSTPPAQAEFNDSSAAVSPVAQTVVKDSSGSDSRLAQTPPKDSLNTNTTSVKDTTKWKDAKTHLFAFNVYAGLNLYRTQSSTLSDKRSVSPLVGLELMHPLSKHFEIGIGTVYSLQGGYNLADTSTQVSYFLEKNVSRQIILIHKQHKLYVPFTIYYVISDKHAVSGGIHWSYLINTVGDYYTINTVSGSTIQSKESDVKGYMDGIKSSSFSFTAGYRFSLSNRFDISTRIVQELTDSYTPQYFYGVNASPSWALQTFISIKF